MTSSSVAFIFPGQGSQKVGMNRDLGSDPKQRWEQAASLLGYSLYHLVHDGPESELTLTSRAQPAIFVMSAVILDHLHAQGIRPDYVAGHSLGELTAYYAAGALSFESALSLIQVRGEAMANASPPHTTGMAAVMGVSEEALNTLLLPFGEQVTMANFNTPSQIVISGHKGGLDQVAPLIKEQGGKMIPLPVSGAFHSPYMRPAQHALSDYLVNHPLGIANVPIVLNRTAQPEEDGAKLTANLPLQVVSSVRWVETVAWLAKRVDRAIEVGPGAVLTGLCKKCQPTFPVTSIASEQGVLDWQRLISGGLQHV